MSARRRTARDQRRRQLGQNFLRPDAAETLIADIKFSSEAPIVEIGPGKGVLTALLAQRGHRVIAVEKDPDWYRALKSKMSNRPTVRIVNADILDFRPPSSPYYLIGSLPFAKTTAILRHFLDRPANSLIAASVIVQWEVAVKRTALPPNTLLSTSWAPWWTFTLVRQIPATAFRPVPRVHAGLLTIARRDPPLLPPDMAPAYATFLRQQWPFG